MNDKIRESMIWLHTWSCLILGWLLFAVFLTGTIAFFQVEVSHWMKPESHASVPSEKSLQVGLDRLQQVAPAATSWQVSLPNERERTLGLSWENPDEERQRRRGPREVVDASTGETIDNRETRGGGFLYRFHFELYHLPRGVARWIVGIASMMMFVGLMTGLFTRRKLFAQFFTFRPKRNAMSWIDAHVVTGLMALPFHIMITFSGLMLFANTLLVLNGSGFQGGGGGGPGGPNNMGNRGQIEQQQRAGNGQREERAGGERDNRNQQEQRADRGEQGGGNRGRRQGERQRNEQPPFDWHPDIDAMIRTAESRWGERVSNLRIQNPMTAEANFNLRSGTQEVLSAGRGGSPSMTFDINGNIVEDTAAGSAENGIQATYSTLRQLHEAHFADTTARWLLFFAGVLGTFMCASGSILWVIKRRKKQHGKAGFELVNALNVGGIAGLLCAVGAYFWANRLLPVDMANRSDWEIHAFFLVWALCLIHGFIFRHRKGWVTQLCLGSFLFIAIPLLDTLTSPVGLWQALMIGDWLRLGFDGICVLFGASLFAAVYYLALQDKIGKFSFANLKNVFAARQQISPRKEEELC